MLIERTGEEVGRALLWRGGSDSGAGGCAQGSARAPSKHNSGADWRSAGDQMGGERGVCMGRVNERWQCVGGVHGRGLGAGGRPPAVHERAAAAPASRCSAQATGCGAASTLTGSSSSLLMAASWSAPPRLPNATWQAREAVGQVGTQQQRHAGMRSVPASATTDPNDASRCLSSCKQPHLWLHLWELSQHRLLAGQEAARGGVQLNRVPAGGARRHTA